MANKKPFGNTNIYSAASMAMDMMEQGVKDGYLPTAEAFPHIPEIMAEARPVCVKLYALTAKWNKEENPKEYEGVQLMDSVLRMCFYTGMGAVFLWNEDWNTLQEKGIFNALAEPRGWVNMDEYAMHLAGADYHSEAGDALEEHCLAVRVPLLQYVLKQKTYDDVAEQIIECTMAMYYYGMILGMSRLGMH